MKGRVMKKKLLVSGITVVAILGATASYADYAVKRALSNQVVAMLDSSTTKSEIAQLEQSVQVPAIPPTLGSGTSMTNSQTQVSGAAILGVESPVGSSSTSSLVSTGATTGSTTQSPRSSGSSSSGSPSSSAPSAPLFSSRQQVVNYAMSHFTQGEIVHFMTLYMNRSELTVAEKQQIKRQILSHFTAGEIQAMASAATKFH